jgi:RND family efflux transporter MFP subunit
MRVSVYGLASFSLGMAVLCGCGRGGPGAAARSQESARPVSVAPAEVRPLTRTIPVTGTLAARESSLLSAKVSGRLQQLNVDLGSAVREGDLLAQVEPRDYELRLQQASAALAQARAALGLPPEGDDDRLELDEASAVRQAKAVLEEAASNQERVKSLSKSGIASRSELDVVESSYKVARSRYDGALEEARMRMGAVAQRRAEYELARKQLDDASVRAPFAGAIQSRPAHLGEFVAIGTPIVELVKADPLRLRLQVPERESALVRTGQLVRLLVEGDTNVYSGQIARISPAVDEQDRMLRVEADVPARGSLRPGLFARADIMVNEREESLVVPLSAVATFAGIEKVIVVQQGKAVEKVVATGRRGTDWAEIVSGISAGDGVVLDPGGLRTGQAVSINPGNPGARREASAKQAKEPTTN